MTRKRGLVSREFGPLRSEARLGKAAPFVKWAGGKAQLLGQMTPYFPGDYDSYLEPFLGGGAVFFHLQPGRALLSDTNPELIATFQTVRDSPDELMAALDGYVPFRNDHNYYYRVRALNPQKLGQVERAARTIFLNKTCYNGLYRVNSRGMFNVPFGRYKDPNLYDRENLLAASAALSGKIITVGDYRDVLSFAKQGDFAYLDPPYQPLSTTSSFTGYTKDAFGSSDQKELSRVFRALDDRGVRAMLSNSATDVVAELYAGYRIVKLRAARAINSKGEGRGRIDEFLIMNY